MQGRSNIPAEPSGAPKRTHSWTGWRELTPPPRPVVWVRRRDSAKRKRRTIMESGLGIISWIIFGALAGWVASMIAGTNREQGWLENIIVGIVGAFLGGLLFGLLTGRQTYFEWSIGSFVVAVIGALVLLFILRLVRRA